MTSRFVSAAEEEFAAAAEFYEKERIGLGEDFIAKVFYTLTRIERFPMLGSPVTAVIRSYHVTRFPYKIVYRIDSEIVVVAVAHHSRKPDYWKERS